jgi:hypothetical protein
LFQRDEDFSASWPTDDEWRVTEVWKAVLCQLTHGDDWRVIAMLSAVGYQW